MLNHEVLGRAATDVAINALRFGLDFGIAGGDTRSLRIRAVRFGRSEPETERFSLRPVVQERLEVGRVV